MYKHAVTKLPFLIKIVLDQWKIQKMCGKAILEKGGTSLTACQFPDCYTNQQMCDKAADSYHHALVFLSITLKKMFDKDVVTHLFTIKYLPEC